MEQTRGDSVQGGVEVPDLIPDLNSFVRHNFDRAPAVFPAAMAGQLHLLPKLTDLDELLRTVDLPYVQLERDSIEPKSAYYKPASVSGGPEQIDVDKVWQLYAAGKSLVLGQMEEVFPAASTVMRPLSWALSARTNVLVVATAAGQQGIRPHADKLDVVVVQSEGAKNWRVWPTPAEGRDGFKFIDVERIGPPLLEVTLRPGDVLYLPHGTPHAAATKDQPSVHFSITHQLPTSDDILRSVLESATAGLSSKDVVALTDGNVSAIASQLSQRLDVLMETIESLDIEASLRDFRSLRRATLYPDPLFNCTSVEIQILGNVKDTAQVRVGQHTATIPNSILDAVARARAADKPATGRQLFPDLSDGAARTVTGQLVQLGILALAPLD